MYQFQHKINSHFDTFKTKRKPSTKESITKKQTNRDHLVPQGAFLYWILYIYFYVTMSAKTKRLTMSFMLMQQWDGFEYLCLSKSITQKKIQINFSSAEMLLNKWKEILALQQSNSNLVQMF